MLLVNATYSPSAVFSYSVSGLIPGMDYTIRFWVRNICVGACSSNPNGGGGSGPGVLPNLIFAVNGADRYSTGPVPSGVGWREHTFTFNTGTLTAGNLVIRNNAPGGGGNDWVIDDISLNRCLIILPEAVEKLAVERTENTSIVKWSIANDQALKEYVVQYSEDGKSFEDAGSVLASGRGGNYSYNDVRSISNKLYYRIKSINKNNEERYSKTVMIRAGQQLTKSLKISPNPASQNPAVQFNVARRTAAAITIVDGAGRLVSRSNVQAESGMNSHTISTKLAPGIYTVVVDCGNGDILRERLVIIDK
jgi:Secretion system C-terminal sorting domain